MDVTGGGRRRQHLVLGGNYFTESRFENVLEILKSFLICYRVLGYPEL